MANNESKSELELKTVWRLRAGLEKKFTKGHPWVFSNDLDQSPKGLPPGAIVELRDSRDGFLAIGYGNPSTLIAFRTLTRTPTSSLRDLMAAKFQAAARIRQASGVDRYSHRLVFGEADGIPGIIVDRYLLTDSKGDPTSQVFVIQSSTAGGDRILPDVEAAIATFQDRNHAFEGRGATLPLAIVIAQDSSARAMEGLTKLPRSVRGVFPSFDAKRATIAVQSGDSASSKEPALYDVDFIEGQKTGFFLDQRLNVRLAWTAVTEVAKRRAEEKKDLRVLDLFTYVGQWSVQIAKASARAGTRAYITMADASATALEFAKHNAERASATADARKMDILAEISQLPVGGYDVVICDPPAFIKKKKDAPTGRAAYVKLNREAIKRVAPGGVFVSCSCSGLMTDEEFVEVLADARKASGREIVWLIHGGHGEDHPYRSEFPQGRYLKGWIGIVL